MTLARKMTFIVIKSSSSSLGCEFFADPSEKCLLKSKGNYVDLSNLLQLKTEKKKNKVCNLSSLSFLR